MGAKPRYCEERGGREGGRGGREGEERGGDWEKERGGREEIITLRKEDNDLRVYKETFSEVI